jgi:hypothetical protein
VGAIWSRSAVTPFYTGDHRPATAIVRFPVMLVLTPLACGLRGWVSTPGCVAVSPGRGPIVAWAVTSRRFAGAGGRASGDQPVAGFAERLGAGLLSGFVSRTVLAASACVALATIVVAGCRQAPSPRWLRPVVAVIAIAELVSAHLWLNPSAPAALLAQRPTTVAALAADGATPLTRTYVRHFR